MCSTFFFVYIYYQFLLNGNLKKKNAGNPRRWQPYQSFFTDGTPSSNAAFFTFFVSTVTAAASGFLASINTHARRHEWTTIPHNNIILLSNLPRISGGTVYKPARRLLKFIDLSLDGRDPHPATTYRHNRWLIDGGNNINVTLNRR